MSIGLQTNLSGRGASEVEHQGVGVRGRLTIECFALGNLKGGTVRRVRNACQQKHSGQPSRARWELLKSLCVS